MLKIRPQRPTQPAPQFFEELRHRFDQWQAVDADDRKAAEEDVAFAAGDQWDDAIAKARKDAKRPVLTENRLGPSIQQVVNDSRQNKPAISCTPDDGGNEDTAEYFQHRIRQIEYESDADVAYDTSAEQQVTCGRGWYRVRTHYKSAESDEQCIRIEPIDDQFSVGWDPSATRYDLEDMDWCFVVRTISKAQHEREFGKETTAGKQGFYLQTENPAPKWIGIGGSGALIQIADYYYRDYDDLREDGTPKVKICITNGVEVLDETEWIGSTIPVIPVWGLRKMVDGVVRTYSLIRPAKDPQRLVNLYASNIAEQIAAIPKAPYLVAEGSIAGREGEWAQANTHPKAVMQYKPFVNGQPVPPPSREIAEPPIQALVLGYRSAIDAIKACMGIFDASLGAGAPDVSGIAIRRRQTESDVSNFHFTDNQERSRKRLGRILLEIIPLIDGVEPSQRPIRLPNGDVQMVTVNQPFYDAKTGKDVHYQPSQGSYGVAVSTGPSYTSARQEENERIGDLIKAMPELAWVMGDLFLGTSDGPGAQEMAERMKRAIAQRSPGLVDQEGDPRQMLQQASIKINQAQQQIQVLTQQNQQMFEVIQSKRVEEDARFRVEALKSYTQLEIAKLNAETKRGVAIVDAHGDQIQQAMDHAHELGMMAAQTAHQALQTAIPEQEMQQPQPEQQPAQVQQ